VAEFNIADVGADEQQRLEDEFLRGIPLGIAVGNKTLRDQLKWEKDKYYAVKHHLLDKGKVENGRGKGGSTVRLHVFAEEIKKEDVPVPTVPPSTAPTPLLERDLYLPISKVLQSGWLRDRGFDRSFVEHTSQAGKKKTGVWSRPDLTVIGFQTFPYVPGKFLDVVTFEIKPQTEVDVRAVYEALAHRRKATRCYVVFYMPDGKSDDELVNNSDFQDVLKEAKRLGVGILRVTDLNEEAEEWFSDTEAERVEPDPEQLNTFLSNQISEDTKQEIVKWLR
jgi:hypothetical protein